MITLYIYFWIIAIELVVILLFQKRIKKHKFFVRIYDNYSDMFYILGILILILNGFITEIIHILINSIQHIIK